MTRPAALLLVASLALYAASLDHFFVSDDFLNLERNGFRTIGEALGFFSTDDVDFYRPIPRLHFGILQGLFSDRVVAWNLIGVLLHALVSAGVVALASSLFGPADRRAARWAGLFFAVHFIHVEPVMWASGVTTLYVTLFALAAIVLFRRGRETGSVRDRTLAVLAYFLALLSKETAIVIPILLGFVTVAWPGEDAAGRPRSRRIGFREALPYGVLTVVYLLIVTGIDRGGDASPYRLTPGPHVLKNAAFFLLGGFVPVRYWEIRDLWAEAAASGAGLLSFGLAIARRPDLGAPLAAGIAAIGVAAARGGRNVRGSLLWILLAALPFLPLPGSGERFAYLPSVGACLALGLGAQALLRRGRVLPGGVPAARGIVAVGLLVILAGNLDRQSDWATAGRWTRAIRDRWTYFRELEAGLPIEFVGIPDDYRSAWVFRNGFDSLARLYWEGRAYRREGELPPGAPRAWRMRVTLDPNGNVGMRPDGPRSGP